VTHFVSASGKSPDRVLVVDDNEPGRYAKTRILRQAGYVVSEAANGGEALRLAGGENPDLILLDVRLPDMSGLEVCRRIKANPLTSAIPVLQMSASFRDDQSKVAGLECGADGYLAEPVEPALLIATIAAFLRARKAELAVREYALEWRVTFDAIADGVAMVDIEGKIVRSNRALASLLNRPGDELIGARLDELLPGAGADGTIWHKLATGQRQMVERSAGGRAFSLAFDPVFSQGQLRGGVCIVSDITERKLMDERLWHTQKLESIGVLAGGVAHDFNNLLMGILGNASLGLETLDDPRATERALRDIVRASERAADLTRQLLAYSGKGRFVIQLIDLSLIVSGMLPLARASFPRKVKLVPNLAKSLPAIKADKTQVEQIVMNLVINAAEAIGERAGTVTVATKERHFSQPQQQRYLTESEICGDYVMLEVRDDGIGMDEETIARIFDPFFTTKFMGRGLGLSAVLGIMRGHQGAIRVNSAPGLGTTFELLFPSVGAAVPEAVPEPAATEPVRGSAHGRILVVDDERIVRDFFRSSLERHGYEVVVATDGAEGLRIFSEEQGRFTMVLLDLVMPVMNGKDVLPRLLEVRPDARIVVTSGQVEEEVRRELSEWKIAGFIQKPCAMRVLIEKIQTFLEPQLLTAG
jgi:PAS domain S-box-containing protein